MAKKEKKSQSLINQGYIPILKTIPNVKVEETVAIPYKSGIYSNFKNNPQC